MDYSILPLYLVIVFVFSLGITHRAAVLGTLTERETRRIHILIGTLFLWALVCAAMGVAGLHTSPALQARIPFLWQAVVPVLMVATGLIFSAGLRRALGTVAAATPLNWLVWIQALRMGALGGILKELRGEIESSYVFWVGIPDLFYGISAVVLGTLLMFRPLSRRMLMAWHIVGPAIILLPTFGGMNAFMNEPGFIFIFEFPMVLAPGIVVPFLIFLNLTAVWKLWETAFRAAGGNVPGQRASVSSSCG